MPSVLTNVKIAVVFAFLVSAWVSLSAAPTPPPTSATVKILNDGGHGSGVHIGDRFVLTAAHVIAGASTVQVKADDGSVQHADVLWTNTRFDVSLVRYRAKANMKSAELLCREAKVGDPVKASGSPGNIEFISTSGHISGSSRKHGPWESVLVFDGVVAPGMSGGPVFDTSGRIIGLTVGLMAVPMGFGASLIPVSYIVPSTAVCALMAR